MFAHSGIQGKGWANLDLCLHLFVTHLVSNGGLSLSLLYLPLLAVLRDEWLKLGIMLYFRWLNFCILSDLW